MKLILFIALFGPLFSIGQVFPIVDNGLWGMVNADGEIVMEPTYSYLSEPDEYGNVIAQNSQGYFGLLDSTLKEKTPLIYKTITQEFYSLYVFDNFTKKDLIDVSDGKVIQENITKTTKIGRWHLLESENTKKLYNFILKTTVELEYSDKVVLTYDKLILIKRNGLYTLIHYTDGVLVTSEKNNVTFDYEIRLNDFNGYTFYSQSDRVLNFPRLFDQVEQIEYHLYHCRVNDSSFIYNSELESLNFVGDFERLSIFYEANFDNSFNKIIDSLYFVYSENKVGLLRLPDQVMFKPKFDNIYKQGDNIFTENDELTGLLSKNCRELIEPKFQSIYESKEFYFAYNEDGYQLFSKSGKAIVTEPANRFDVNLPIVKAYKGRTLTHYVVENGVVLGKTEFPNSLTIARGGWSPRTAGGVMLNGANQNRSAERDSLPGWFSVEREYYTKDSVLKKRTLWGIKNSEDSILQKPRFHDRYRVSGTQITKALFGKDGVQLYFTDTNTRMKVGSIQHFGDEWYSDHSIAPLLTRRSFGFLDSTGTFTKYDWIELDQSKKRNIVVRNEGKTIEYSKPGIIDGTLPAMQTWTHIYGIPSSELDKGNRRFKFEIPKYNFIDSTGRVIFKTWFDHAEPMYMNRSIVEIDGKYGVVNQDSIIIPIKYSSITKLNLREVDDLGQTNNSYFYLLTLSNGKRQYYNAQLEEVDFLAGKIYKTNDFHLLRKIGRQIDVENHQGEKLATDFTNVKLYDDGKFSTKKKRRLSFYDKTGQQLSEDLPSPIDWLSDEQFTYKEKTGIGLMDIFGSELLVAKYKEIEKEGEFYKVYDGVKFYLLNNKYEEISKSKSDFKLLGENGEDYYAIQDKKLTFYNANKEKLNELELQIGDEVSLKKGLVWIKNDEQLTIKNFDGMEVFSSAFERMIDLDENYTVIFNEKERILLNQSAEVVYSQLSGRITQVSPVIFKMTGPEIKGFRLYNIENMNHLDAFWVSEFSEGKAVVSKNLREYYYIDTNLEEINHFVYKEAQLYHAGKAIVRMSTGYTLIDEEGRMLSYPSFSGIQYVNENCYLSTGNEQTGLANFNAEIVIPEEFKKIEYKGNKVFAVINNGEIGYYRTNGELLYNPN